MCSYRVSGTITHSVSVLLRPVVLDVRSAVRRSVDPEQRGAVEREAVAVLLVLPLVEISAN